MSYASLPLGLVLACCIYLFCTVLLCCVINIFGHQRCMQCVLNLISVGGKSQRSPTTQLDLGREGSKKRRGGMERKMYLKNDTGEYRKIFDYKNAIIKKNMSIAVMTMTTTVMMTMLMSTLF